MEQHFRLEDIKISELRKLTNVLWSPSQQKSIEICYFIAGEGVPTLFVHGLGGCKEIWQPQYTNSQLLKHLTFIVPDLPGFGESEKPKDTEYNIQLGVETLLELIQAFGRVNAIGVSLGARLCFELARLHPELVRKLVLIACPGLGPEINQRLKKLSGFFSLPGSGMLKPSKKRIEQLLQGSFWDPQAIPSGLAEKLLEYSSTPALRNALRHGISFWRGQRKDIAIAEKDLLEVPKLVPTLMMWGNNDKIIPVHHLRKAQEMSERKIQTYSFDRCGHWPQIEKSEQFNKKVLEFLKN